MNSAAASPPSEGPENRAPNQGTDMKTTHDTDRDLRNYLLGELDDAGRDAFEVELLADDDAYAALLAAEDDLIDAYARGELAGAERAAFETRFLPRPDSAERIAFARHLATLTARGAAARSGAAGFGERLGRWFGVLRSPVPALRLAPLAAALLLAVATGWLAWNGFEMSGRVADLETANARLADERAALAERGEGLAAELVAARRQADVLGAGAGDAAALAAAERRIAELEGEMVALRRLPERPRRVATNFVLSLATRSAGVPVLVVPAAADDVRLQLDTAGDAAYYDVFQARLLDPGGAEAWSATGLAADAATGTVDVELAAGLLAPGRYEVLLEGSADGGAPELVGAYEFEVRRP